MTAEEQALASELFHLINHFIDQKVEEKIKPLMDKVQKLEAQQDEWVNTKEATRITGVTDDTLKAERDRPRTLIEVKFEGKTGKKPLYSRASLLAYNESRTQRRTAGRNLAA